jgi:uncharacterized protein (TIGR02421 family)
MEKRPIHEFSDRLKEIAKDLSFLGHPRYPVKELSRLFPQHPIFIQELEDISVPFKVNVKDKRAAINQLMKDVDRSPLDLSMKEILLTRSQDYQTLLLMMENFGKPRFYELARSLYGSSRDLEKKESFISFLDQLPQFASEDNSQEMLSGDAAIKYLAQRLRETFGDADIEVKASTSLLSDSSAGRRVLKLNPYKSYTLPQLQTFLVHEGWAHLGTSLNGAAQSEHTWLSTWAPRTTFLQEGLALLTEIITGSLTKERWNKVLLRHLATSMAERGSNIQEVYEYLRHEGMQELDAFKLALRIFRGVPLEGGMAFTKELLYLHGLIALLKHLDLIQGELSTLWIGKISFREHAIALANWRQITPQLKYYPMGLKDPLVLERLKKLRDLSRSRTNPDF